MTISKTNNSTYETCPICQIDYTDIEREDTRKVVELACSHFFHMQCIDDWFSRSERDERDLSCGYCSQLSVEKFNPIDSLTLETLTASFEKIKKNPIFNSNPNIINCIEKLRPLSASLIDLINNNPLTDNNSLEGVTKIVEDWIKANLNIELQRTAANIIIELYTGGGALQPLEDQIRHLSRIPYDKWPREIETSGVPVSQKTDSGPVRMRVSKNYLQRATALGLCDRIQNHKALQSHIEHIKSFYYYDDGVMDAIPHARNLQKDLSRLLKENPISSLEKIFLLLENKIEGMDITDDLKEDTRLIMNKFLFNRPALRTITQEIDRWKKIPVRNWPLFIRGGGIRVLDEDNSVKRYDAEDFKRFVLEAGGTLYPPIEKMDIVRTLVIGTVICGIISSLFKRS